MQIVIDIPEDVYDYIKANGARIPYYKLTDVIKSGTPLPKGHGRLIDADKLWLEEYEKVEIGFDDYTSLYNAVARTINEIVGHAETIIEADKSFDK